jgi:hypothetical protein
LGCFPLWGREGVTPHNNRGLPKNSKIKDFYRAVFFNFPLVFIRYFTADYSLAGRY